MSVNNSGSKQAVERLDAIKGRYDSEWGAPPLEEIQKAFAAICREGLNKFIEEGFKGSIWLGPIRQLSSEGGTIPSDYYGLDGKHLYGSFPSAERILGIFKKKKVVEIKPDSIPFEKYSPGFLEYIANNVRKTIEKIS